VSEVARRAASGQFGDDVDATLEVEATYDGGEGGWSGGTHCAIVEVDAETGLVKVERYAAVEDCGALINPAVVEGQIRGGIAQGIGAVLLERSAYGEDGSFQSATFMDYLMPTTCDIPRIEIEHLETVPLDADVNFRGVGEGGMIVAPPTVVNAIEDALSPFGVRIYEQHLPPARILELIAAADPAVRWLQVLASAFDEDDVTPVAIVPSDALPGSDDAESGGPVQRHAGGVLRENAGLDGPDAVGLGGDDKGTE
jgi:carbon-monoxide dehydrogenase large subunit